jgi:hypothetical protein
MVKHDGNFNHQSGWWLLLTSLKNDGVRQDDDIPKYGKNVPNHQPAQFKYLQTNLAVTNQL